MDDLIAEIKKIYIEQLTKTLAPYKFLIFILSLLGILKAQDAAETSILYGMALTEVIKLFNFSEGAFSKTLIIDIIYSVVLSFISLRLYKFIRISVFQRLAQKNRFEEYAQKLIEKAKNEMTQEKMIDIFLVKNLKQEIEKRKASIVQLHSFGEILMTFLALFLLGVFFKKSLHDLIASLITLALILWIQRSSFVFYLEKLVPLIATRKAFMDENFKLKEGLD